jgi:hypothetical protein
MRYIAAIFAIFATACSSVAVDHPCEGDGGAGGAGTASSSASGAPMCPPSACPALAQAINCEATCGPVSPACADACNDDASVVTIGVGSSEFRTPELHGAMSSCTPCPDGRLAGWRFKLPSPASPKCLAIVGPDPLDIGVMGIIDVLAGSPPPSVCTEVHHGGILGATTDGAQFDRYLVIAITATTNGATFTMNVSDNCDYLVLDPGCNGTGG